ncbi:hypothetical protein PGT21_033265 [Puccinia graminis f. sp. tritici]|uniref:Uncharacterized protein n=1 Tax=Puccinia graminis f. sp. tritici TaxID=56615 RepID=A0A5B0Q7B1_PUCGR|nr:hypothetical protein PGT21_033265 [Puccinia graminis f. sp. tritici]
MPTAAKDPPWPDTVGKTLTPSFVFALVGSKMVPRSLPGSLLGHWRWRFQDKRQANRPFFPSSSSSTPIPSSMARSAFNRPPTPYPAQPHPQPFTRIEMVDTVPMNLDAAVGPPTSAPPVISTLPLAARIAPAGAIPPPFGRGPPPAYFGPNPVRPRPSHGYRRYNINGSRGGFRGERLLTLPPRNLNSPIAESVHSSRAASPQASESHAGTVEDFLIPQSRVPSPNPPGFYDPEDYHRLTRDQVESLLDRRAQPERFNRYDFTPQHFTDLYESITTAMVHHFTTYPAANAAERDSRVRLFRFATCRYRTMTRRV